MRVVVFVVVVDFFVFFRCVLSSTQQLLNLIIYTHEEEEEISGYPIIRQLTVTLGDRNIYTSPSPNQRAVSDIRITKQAPHNLLLHYFF